ncbi:MAG: hypothetical protein ACYC6V_02895 [Bacillota bacterium]
MRFGFPRVRRPSVGHSSRRLAYTVREVIPGVWAWLRRPVGASTTEYALLLALVVVILIGSLTALGETLRDKLQEIINSIKASG